MRNKNTQSPFAAMTEIQKNNQYQADIKHNYAQRKDLIELSHLITKLCPGMRIQYSREGQV